MKICFFGCLEWFGCNLRINAAPISNTTILTESGDSISTENNSNLIIE